MTTKDQGTDAGTGWLDGLLVLAVVALAALLGCAVIRNADVWTHLATGRLIAKGQYQYGVDPFCHTTANDVWINHAWGFDIGLYWVFQQFGGAGVVLMRCGIVLITTMFLLCTRRPSSGLALSAMVVAVALIAANGRLPMMQPTLCSYMDLAILMWILPASPHWHRRWLAPAAIFLLHVHWVNHDSWFILGPFIIVFWLIGSLLQPNENDGRGPTFWLGLLGCAVIGGLVNPHHVFAYVLPDELVPTFMDPSIGAQPFFDALHFSAFDARFRNNQPGPAYATYVMMLLGVVSFALNVASKPWRRLLLWMVLAGLACWRARFIPFFVIGSAPLVVHNIQEGMTRFFEPTAYVRMVGITLRSVAALVIFSLCFVAWPGWLGPSAQNALRTNRVGLRIEHDTGMEELARKLNELQTSSTLPTNTHVYSPSNEMANYMAWYAPSLKSFIDSRWRLHAPRIGDFLAARQFFTNLDTGRPSDLKKLTATLQPYAIGLIALNGSDRGDGTGPGRVLFTDPQRFPLLALSGRATAFAWNIDASPIRPVVDAPRLAFAPQAASRIAPPSDEEPNAQTAWERYVSGIRPRSMQLEEAAAWHEFTDAAQMRVNEGMKAAAVASLVGGASTDAALHWRTMMNFHPATATAPNRVVAPDRLAGAVLAVRYARAALAAQNESAEAAYRLSQAYSRMASVDSLLTLQYATTLTQAKSRLAVFTANGWDESQVAYLVAKDLAAYHSQLNIDLFVENSKTVLDLMRRPQIAMMFNDPKAFESEFKGRQKQLEAVEKKLALQRDQLDVDPKSPPFNRMARAEQLGLAGEALSIFQRTLMEQPEQLKLQDFAYAVNLMLKLGRAEEARTILMSPQFNPVTAVEPSLQPFFRRLHRDAAAACGDYQRAHDEIAALLDYTRLGMAQTAQTSALAIATAAIALDPIAAPIISRGALVHVWYSMPIAQLEGVRSQRFELLAWQGIIALEQGDTRTAKRAIDEALEELPGDARPQGWEQLSLYKTLLDRAAQNER